ncbi:lipase family alpha/beta hydrolase [Nocardioides cheoyonin]|uniref:lipase family alpha/beta hydrolase n=1 Tax=Nocardioides cheoyonin TaxID=3156615 RepID=UPI0032B575DA
MVPGPTVVDAAALLAQVADELVLRSARDTHEAVGDRVHGAVRRGTLGLSAVPEAAHKGISAAVYAGLGLALRGASEGLGRAAEQGWGAPLEATAGGRLLLGAVNGLIGDRLAEERPRLAVELAVRRDGRDVRLDEDAIAEAFPEATGRVVVLLHGLCESDESWSREGDRRTTYADALAARGWTPVLLRANTGLSVRENGAALASLLERLVALWPTEVTRIALVGHSQGGLVMRAAAAVVGPSAAWSPLVTDVVTLGTPHLGAPLAAAAGWGSRTLARVPESAAFGRILDHRSAGIHDLVAGLGEEVPPLPHARYRLVAAALGADRRDPLSRLLGDLLVRPESAYGRDRLGRSLFPQAEVLHIDGADHFDLLNHPEVHEALERWLG